MILVDSSVWIDFFRGLRTPWTLPLLRMAGHRSLLLGDLILFEVMRGVRNDHERSLVTDRMELLPIVPMVGREIALLAAQNGRMLRAAGITTRHGIDLLIGTFCILHNHALLQNDRDFEPMARHLGLQLVPTGEP